MGSVQFPNLFEPGQIGRVRLRNRVVMLPMSVWGGINGEIIPVTIDHFAEIAKGGVGLVIVGNCSAFGRTMPNCLQIDADWYMAGHYDLAEKVHSYGAKICLQINHPGSLVYPSCLEGRQPVSSSPIPAAPAGQAPYPVPHALERNEIDDIIGKYATGAARARAVGYDMVEIHATNGYLIAQFMSRRLNKRTDEFGGDFENRMRFPLEVIKRVRSALGNDYPVGIRIGADEFTVENALTEEFANGAWLFEQAGVAYVNVSGGPVLRTTVEAVANEEATKLPLWEAIKKAVKAPTIAGGGLRTPAFCDQLLRQGSADYAGLARILLADPAWAAKAREGRLDDIRMCVSCFECLRPSRRRRQTGGARRCSVNPDWGREREFAIAQPEAVKKRVMVIGAGPAGMEAARVAAMRGHQVTLYDRGSAPGGNLLVASAAPAKDKWLLFRDYLVAQLNKLKVEVILNTEVTPAQVEAARPDAVILATGAEPVVPSISIANGVSVVGGVDVLSGRVAVKDQNVAVLGGGVVGCEVAEFLAEQGNHVTIVEARPELAPEMQPMLRGALMVRLNRRKVDILTNKEVVEVTRDGALLLDKGAGQHEKLAADAFVLALGAKANRRLADALDGIAPELFLVGDCAEPRVVMEAVYEGSQAARRI